MFGRLWRRRKEEKQAQETLDALRGMLLANGDSPRVLDNLSYMLPPLLPAGLRAHLEETGKMNDWLRERLGGSAYGVDYDTATDFQFDSPYKSDPPFTAPYEMPLYEWDYSTRRYVAEQARGAYRRNPLAKAVNMTAFFAVGEGFQLNTFNPQVREYLDEFIEHPENRIRRYERKAAIDLLVDGELVLQWGETDMGVPVINPLPPHELVAIRTAPGYIQRKEAYEFHREVVDGDHAGRRYQHRVEVVPADAVTFVAINNGSWQMRGISELYAVLPWLRAYQNWLEDRARVNYYKSLIMYLVRVEANNSADIAAVAARWRKPPKPGSVAVESQRVEVDTVSPNIAGEEVVNDGRQLRMQVAVGLGLPEYFLSDGENANLATASQQELPALYKFENYQVSLVDDLWRPMFEKVLKYHVDAGRLPAMVPKHDGLGKPVGEMIPYQEAFDVNYKPVLVFNELELSKAMVLQVKYGIISRESAMARMGHNAELIMKQIDEDPWGQEEAVDREADDAKEIENDTDSL